MRGTFQRCCDLAAVGGCTIGAVLIGFGDYWRGMIVFPIALAFRIFDDMIRTRHRPRHRRPRGEDAEFKSWP